MKYVITLFALLTIYIYGCGNDTTTNTGNNGNGETVIFLLDSMSLYVPSMGFTLDTNISLTNFSNARISFECFTNADSVSAFSSFRLYALDDSIGSSNVILDTSENRKSMLNNSFLFDMNTNTGYALLNVLIQCIRNDSNSYFIRLRNFKITKVN